MAEKIEMFAGWDWDSSVIVGREMNQHLPNKCTVVVHDDKAERVFTESEVRAMLRDIRHELELNARWQNSVEVISASAVRQAFHRPGVLSLDPA